MTDRYIISFENAGCEYALENCGFWTELTSEHLNFTANCNAKWTSSESTEVVATFFQPLPGLLCTSSVANPMQLTLSGWWILPPIFNRNLGWITMVCDIIHFDTCCTCSDNFLCVSCYLIKRHRHFARCMVYIHHDIMILLVSGNYQLLAQWLSVTGVSPSGWKNMFQLVRKYTPPGQQQAAAAAEWEYETSVQAIWLRCGHPCLRHLELPA